MDFLTLAAECAPTVHPQTISAIVRTESKGDPWAIGINGPKPALSFHKPTTQPEAVQEAKRLIAKGYNIDMGLGQINSANLSWLGLSIEQVFDPCTNLRAASTILADNYIRASKQHPQEQARLAAALSAYNTGSFQRGLDNGYVSKVYLAANQSPPAPVVPALTQEPDRKKFRTFEGDVFASETTADGPTAQTQELERARQMLLHLLKSLETPQRATSAATPLNSGNRSVFQPGDAPENHLQDNNESVFVF